MIQRFLFLSILIGSLFQSSLAQTGANPPDLNTQFDQILSEQYPANGTGCAALVAVKGQVIYRKAFGMADLELSVAMQPDMVFRIGSITKQFTAVAILQLMEQGKLSLQDPITKFIPDYPTQGKTITIEHLLTHTSGIKSYTGMEKFGEIIQKDMKPEELIAFFKNEPMEFEPGTQWNYNNSGYFLLGYIIEKITGKTYPEYLEEHFFKPLGMSQSCYGDDSRIIPRRASGYEPAPGGGVRNADPMSMSLPYAAGSIQSTVGDLFKWHQAVHSHKLVKKESLDKAFTEYKLKDGKGTKYGYGWGLNLLQGSPTIEHSGGINGFLTNAVYLPREDVFVAIFTNSTGSDPGHASNRLAALAVGKPMPVKTEIKVPENILSAYTGQYELMPNFFLTVTLEGGHVFTEATGQGKVEIFAESENKFFVKAIEAEIEFVKNSEGKVDKLILYQGGQQREAKKIK